LLDVASDIETDSMIDSGWVAIVIDD